MNAWTDYGWAPNNRKRINKSTPILMKKILVAAATLFAAICAFAQPSVSVGYLNNTFKCDDIKLPENGFYAGFYYSIDIGATCFKFSPGLFFSWSIYDKSSSSATIALDDEHFLVTSESVSSKMREAVLYIPLQLSYGIDLAPKVHAFVFGGPIPTLGLSAKYSYGFEYTDSEGNVYAEDDKFQCHGNGYRRIDLKIGGGVGIDLDNRFRITAGYDFGIFDRSKSSSSTIHTNIFHAGVGYIF